MTSNDNDHAPLTLKIPVNLLGQLQEAADLAKIDVHSLLLCYARQGLINSSAQLKRQQFLTHAKDVLEEHGVHGKTIEEIFGKFPY
jgi:predicted nicotinamide N-methyase